MKLNQNTDYTKTQISYARNFVDWTGHDKAVMDADRRTRLHSAIDKMAQRHAADPDVESLLRVHRSLDRVLDREENEEPEASSSASAEPEEAADALAALGLDRHDRSSANLMRAIDRAQHRGRSRMSKAMDSAASFEYEIRWPDGRRETTVAKPVRLADVI